MIDNKMNQSTMMSNAREAVAEMLKGTLENNSAELVKPCLWAIPTTVNGQEIWVTLELTAKQFTKTEQRVPYDPFAEREEYQSERAIKDKEIADRKAERERKKEANLKAKASRKVTTKGE